MGVLPAWVSGKHVCLVPEEGTEALDPLEEELEMGVSCLCVEGIELMDRTRRPLGVLIDLCFVGCQRAGRCPGSH